MISNIASAVVLGVEALPIQVEVAVYPGLPGFSLVGLPDTSIREARERVFTAIRSSDFQVPNQRMVVNLSPAHLRKEGTQLDLAIALGILTASGQVDLNLFKNVLCVGELSLQGELKGIPGFLAIDECAYKMGARGLCCPAIHRLEGDFSFATPKYFLDHLKNLPKVGEPKVVDFAVPSKTHIPSDVPSIQDFSEVKGQEWAKKILMVAAVGGHSVLFAGSPGCGKTMLAERMVGLLPKLSFEKALEVTKIHRLNKFHEKMGSISIHPPFRAPHHSISRASLIGGGKIPIPGEVTLAHHGILFLDELTEFSRESLEALRQPLEAKKVEVSRLGYQVTFPANFQLVVALNPCPCGFFLDQGRICKCSVSTILRYMGKISGPFLDRIDLQCELSTHWEKVEQTSGGSSCISNSKSGLSTQSMRQKVFDALEFRKERFKKHEVPHLSLDTLRSLGENSFEIKKETTPSRVKLPLLERECFGNSIHQQTFHQFIRKERVSFRVAEKLLNISRSLADLELREWVSEEDLLEAFEMRALDRTLKETFQVAVH